MNNEKTFDERFGQFIFRSIEGVAAELYGNEEYRELKEEYSKAAKKVCGLISLEVFDELDTATGLLEGFEREHVYIKGLADGIKLFNLLNNGGSNNGKC